jgi:ribosomal-protein-alanine N-acetyltransferase
MLPSDVGDVLALGSGATKAQLKEELGRPWARPRVARNAEGRATGMLLAWNVADEVQILDVAVHPALRRRGIGRALMSDALDAARARAAVRLFLEVRRSNAAAIALYRSFGFYALGVRKRYYPDDEDAVEMALALEPGTGAVVAHGDEVSLEAP